MGIQSIYAADEATTLEAYSAMMTSAPMEPPVHTLGKRNRSVGAASVNSCDAASKAIKALAEAIGTRAVDWSWMPKAACHDINRDVFFVAPMSANSTARTAESSERKQRAVAERYCAGCPVAEECLEYALATKSQDGVWGGKTERERKTILRERKVTLRRQRLEAAS